MKRPRSSTTLLGSAKKQPNPRNLLLMVRERWHMAMARTATANLQKDREVKNNIGLDGGSMRQMDAFDAIATASPPRDCNHRKHSWQTRLQELQEFSQIHGHCRVSARYPQNTSLGHWLAAMRKD